MAEKLARRPDSGHAPPALDKTVGSAHARRAPREENGQLACNRRRAPYPETARHNQHELKVKAHQATAS
jgi:hypothetical protein